MWKVKNFFVHVSMLSLIITYVFDRYCQVTLQNNILLMYLGMNTVSLSDGH